jgi:hypothetical protein
MPVAFHADVSGWQRQIERISREYGVEAKFVLAEVHQLMTAEVQRRLPIARKGGGRGLGGAVGSSGAFPSEAERDDYRGPIQSDLKRIFVPVTAREEVSAEIQSMKAAGGIPVRIFRRKDGSTWAAESKLWSESEGAMFAHHNKYRSKTTGRVSRAGDLGDHYIGRWRFIDKMHVPAELFREYLRGVLARVGKTRSGFNAALRHFSAAVGKAASIQPAVARHGDSFGSFTDNSGGVPLANAELASTNHVPWVSRFKGMAEAVARTRDRDFALYFEKRMPRLVARWEAMRSA